MAVEIIVALVGLVGIGIGAIGTYFATRKGNETNLKIATEKLEAENRLANATSDAIKELLMLPDWELRGFDAIKKHIPGFEDNELRKLLLAAGAISFRQSGTGKELWGLRARNAAKLSPAPSNPPLVAELSAPSDGPNPF
jgi:hypothetical protein